MSACTHVTLTAAGLGGSMVLKMPITWLGLADAACQLTPNIPGFTAAVFMDNELLVPPENESCYDVIYGLPPGARLHVRWQPEKATPPSTTVCELEPSSNPFTDRFAGAMRRLGNFYQAVQATLAADDSSPATAGGLDADVDTDVDTDDGQLGR